MLHVFSESWNVQRIKGESDDHQASSSDEHVNDTHSGTETFLNAPEYTDEEDFGGEGEDFQCRYSYETPEHRQVRLRLQRDRQALNRSRESEMQRMIRLEHQRVRMARKRANETEEERERRLKADRERQALYRAKESPDQRAKRLKADRERMAMKRALESEEERAIRREKDRQRQAFARSLDTRVEIHKILNHCTSNLFPYPIVELQEGDAPRVKIEYPEFSQSSSSRFDSSESSQDNIDAPSFSRHVTKETLEKRALRLQLQRDRQALIRSRETEEQRRIRLENQRLRQARKRANETEEERMRRLKAERERQAFYRSKETPEQRERRLRAEQQRIASRRARELDSFASRNEFHRILDQCSDGSLPPFPLAQICMRGNSEHEVVPVEDYSHITIKPEPPDSPIDDFQDPCVVVKQEVDLD